MGFHRRFLAAPGLLLNRTDAGSAGSDGFDLMDCFQRLQRADWNGVN
jgi:hypothetical protein